MRRDVTPSPKIKNTIRQRKEDVYPPYFMGKKCHQHENYCRAAPLNCLVPASACAAAGTGTTQWSAAAAL